MKNEAHKQHIASSKLQLMTDVLGKSDKIAAHHAHRYGLIEKRAAIAEASAAATNRHGIQFVNEQEDSSDEDEEVLKNKKRRKKMTVANLCSSRSFDWVAKLIDMYPLTAHQTETLGMIKTWEDANRSSVEMMCELVEMYPITPS